MSCRLNTNKDFLDKFLDTCTSADYFGRDQNAGLCYDAFHNSGGSEAKLQLANGGVFTPTQGIHNGCSQLTAEQCTGLAGTPDLAICTTDGCKTNGNRCDRGFLEICAAGIACANGTVTPCVLGNTYQDQTGQATCKPLTVCKAGQKVDTKGTTTADRTCSDCEAGTVSNAENTKECTTCEVGKTYQDQAGQTTCKPQPTCPPDKHRVADSPSDIATCVDMIEHCQQMSDDGKSCATCDGQYVPSGNTCALKQNNPLNTAFTALGTADSTYSGDPDAPVAPAAPTTSPAVTPTTSPAVTPTTSPGTTQTCTVNEGQEDYKAYCDTSTTKEACESFSAYCTWK